MDKIEYQTEFEDTYAIAEQAQPSSRLFTIVHFILFTAMMLCFASLEIFGRSPTAVLIRQVGFTSYVIIIFATKGFGIEYITTRKVIYLLCATTVAVAIFLTTLTLPPLTPQARFIDYLGPVSFLAGVYVFAIVLPQCWRERAELIIFLSAMLVVTSVCLSLYVGTADVIERRNALAAYTGLGILLLLGISLRTGLWFPKRILCWTGVAILAFIMSRALGRTSIVATIIAFLLVVLVGSTFSRKLLWITLLALATVVLLYSSFGQLIIERFVYKSGFGGHRFDIYTLTGRTDIWRTLLQEAGGILWLGKGRLWITITVGTTAHSSYLGSYLEYGIFAMIPWLIMCAMGFWAAIKTLLLYKGTGRYPLAPFCVIYFLILGIAESYFYVMIGGFGALFYICSGLCLLEVAEAEQNRLLGWEEDYESVQKQSAYPLTF